MSNFNCKVKIKATGEIKEVTALDNFFGKHNYGYRLDFNSPLSNKMDYGKVYREDEVEIIPEPTVIWGEPLKKPEPVVKSMRGVKLVGSDCARGRVENDFYATNPESTRALLEVEEIIYPALEPACGEGHISKLLKEGGVHSSDLIYRGYGEGNVDFLVDVDREYYRTRFHGEFPQTIITNPPFSLFQEFAEKALSIAQAKVIMFGKLQALEGQKRGAFLQSSHIKTVYVFKKRQQPMRNGKQNDEITGKFLSSTMAFAWFVWEKGYKGDTIIKWI
jgi:hypothetical protein